MRHSQSKRLMQRDLKAKILLPLSKYSYWQCWGSTGITLKNAPPVDRLCTDYIFTCITQSLHSPNLYPIHSQWLPNRYALIWWSSMSSLTCCFTSCIWLISTPWRTPLVPKIAAECKDKQRSLCTHRFGKERGISWCCLSHSRPIPPVVWILA